METWKDIKGYEGRYQVSDKGRIKRLPYKWIHEYKPRGWQSKEWHMIRHERQATECILTGTKVGPYIRVGLCDGKQNTAQFLVHRLVFCTFNNLSLKFLGQKSKTLILHKDDDPENNALDNLFIGTQKDNVDDMIKKGRKRVGRQKHNKIGFSDIETIRQKHKELGSIHRVGELFGVSGATISRALNGKIWKL